MELLVRGYVNYYSPVNDYPFDIQYIYYLLTYSCVYTLAQKRNCSLRAIFKKYGNNITINYNEKIDRMDTEGNMITQERKKTVQLLKWDHIKNIVFETLVNVRKKQKEKQSISTIDRAIDEICNVRINWRTKYKLTKHCAICGSQDHVRHVRIGKITGFLQIMKQLNRKQIPCCRSCHRRIHNGQYDGMSLKDLYDEEFIIL